MGMYDCLHNISRNIEQNQVDIKKSQEHQKKVEYIQTELEGALLGTIQEYINEYNYNIFDEETKAIIIDEILHNTNLTLYNKDYTIQYLNKKYYTIARQVEQIEKKKNINNDWRKDLAIAKFEYQKQKDDEKSQLELQKIEALKRQQRQQIMNTLFKIGLKILKWLSIIIIIFTLAPVVIGGLFLFGMIKGLAGIK